MDAVVDDLVEHLCQVYSTYDHFLSSLMRRLGQTDRYLVGISGAPGSGKTTIAARVVTSVYNGFADSSGIRAESMESTNI